jgi:hypothetical protein
VKVRCLNRRLAGADYHLAVYESAGIFLLIWQVFLMFRMIYSFTATGGGVHGKAAGIVPDTMTEAGRIIEVYRLSTNIFIPAGETATRIMYGMAIPGNTSAYIIGTGNVISTHGKETDSGKGIPGE